MIERSEIPSDYQRTGNHQGQEKDYAEFNRKLDIIRDAFLSLHSGVANEERWRWDAPTIAFSWGNGTIIHRNLNGMVLGANFPSGIEVESNAWADINEGKILVRYWKHFSAGRVDSADITSEKVADLVEKAYKETTSWEKEDLQERQVLTT